MELVQLTGGRPSQFLPHVRYVVEFSSAGHNAQRKIEYFLKALYVFVRTVAIDRETISDVREDQGADHSRQELIWDLVTHVGQSDEDTVAFLDEGRYVRVPGEVLVENHAKVPHRGPLTDRVLTEPNRDRVQATAILTRAKHDEFSFVCINF